MGWKTSRLTYVHSSVNNVFLNTLQLAMEAFLVIWTTICWHTLDSYSSSGVIVSRSFSPSWYAELNFFNVSPILLTFSGSAYFWRHCRICLSSHFIWLPSETRMYAVSFSFCCSSSWSWYMQMDSINCTSLSDILIAVTLFQFNIWRIYIYTLLATFKKKMQVIAAVFWNVLEQLTLLIHLCR